MSEELRQVYLTFETEHGQKLKVKADYDIVEREVSDLNLLFLYLLPSENPYPFDHLTSRDQGLLLELLTEEAERVAFGHGERSSPDPCDEAKEARLEALSE